MAITRKVFIWFFLSSLLFVACEKAAISFRLPEVEPMSFKIPDDMKHAYERLHRKGDDVYTYEEFFGEKVRIPRPPFEKEKRLKDKEELIEVKTYLGKFDEADKLLDTYLLETQRSSKSLLFAGHYCLNRNNIEKALPYLIEHAQQENSPENWLSIIEIAREQYLSNKKYEYLDNLIAAFPDSQLYYKKRIAELKSDKRTVDVIGALKEFYAKFPDEKQYFLYEMQIQFSSLDRDKKAVTLYFQELDPLRDSGAVSDFFSFLESINKLREYRKQWKKRKDKKSMLLLFMVTLRVGNGEEAESIIARFNKRFPEESYLIGKLYRRLGYPETAYEYFLKTISEKGESEEILFEIFDLLVNSSIGSLCSKTRPAADVIFSFDTGPGIAGGLLSLYYNTLEYDRRKKDFEYTKGQIVNLSFAYETFSYFLKKYPNSTRRDSLYVLMMAQLNRFHLYEQAIETGNEYVAKGEREKVVSVYESLAKAYYGFGRTEQGNRIYRNLLTELSVENRMGEYHVIFDRFIAKLIGQKNYEECTRLYWEEIKKHPDDRQLYERFLSLIYNYNLYHEELRIYKYAIKHFNEKTWHHKVARWYIRHKSEEAFRVQTRKIREIFDDKELEAYLREFVHFDSRKSFNNPGNRFYLAMYKYGMNRFPDNIVFARGLIRFYSGKYFRNEKALAELYKKYFFHDDDIRQQFLTYLAEKKVLTQYLRKAKERKDVVYLVFTAEALKFLSRNEESEIPLVHLTLLYPDRLEFAEGLANLYRSIDFSYYHESRKLTEKGVGVFLREIQLFPTVDTLYTQLGEMLVEANRYEQAREEWMKRINIFPGMQSSYLNVATILWDYYDFANAVTVIKKGRQVVLNDTLFSKEMAILYEELKDYKSAVTEYINASLVGDYFYYDMEEVISRLMYLERVHNLGKLIEEIFIITIQKSDNPDRVVEVYADYLERLGLYEKKIAMYAEIMPFLEDPFYMREILSELEVSDRTSLVVDYAKRLVDVTQDVEDYLILASTYENQKKISKAKSIYGKLIKLLADEPWERMEILEEYSEFLWRNKEHGKSLDLLFDAQSMAKGSRKASILHSLAYRALSLNDFKRAKKAFDMLLNEDPYNVHYFNLVGDMYEKLGDARGLENVYLERIQLLGKSPLGYEEKRFRTKELYLGLARRLKELKKETRAQDYYIEAINRDPQDISLLDESYTFSKKHALVSRLVEYYNKTAMKSFKDYRWQMVLVRFYLREGNISKAISELEKAVINQPQKAFLHEELADKLTMQGKYDDAIKEYEEAYILTKSKNEITKKIAFIYLRRNEKEKMFRKFDELIQSKPKGPQKYFDVARMCIDYGLDDEAFQYALQGKQELEQHPYTDYLSDNMLSTLSEVYLRKGRGAHLVRFLLIRYKKYYGDTKKEESYARNEAHTRSSRIRYFISSKLPELWNDYASEKDRRYFSKEFDGFTSFSHYSDFVRALLQFAKSAEMPELAERIMIWKYENEKKKTNYPSLYEITSFYETRGAFDKLYSFLRRESSDYSRLSKLARILSQDEELMWLQKFYYAGEVNYQKYKNTFTYNSPLIDRYITILLQGGMQKELNGMLGRATSYNGQILNYFYERKDGERTFQIIEGGFPNKSDLWRKAKMGFVALHLDYRKDDGIGYFKDILDIRSVGEKIEGRRNNILTGKDFSINCFFFGMLDSSYLLSRVEVSPRSSGSYRHLGNYYYDNKKYKSARDYLLKAVALSPSNATYIDLARVHIALHDKKSALNALGKLDGDNFYSKEQYIQALMETGFEKEARRTLSDYLLKMINNLSYGETKQALTLADQVLEKSEPFFKELSQKIVKNETFYNVLLKNRKLQNSVYFIKRYLDLLEKGKRKKNFYRRQTFIEMLIKEKKYDDGLEILMDTEKGISKDSLPNWVIPLKAELYIRMDKTKEGVKVLNDYVKGREFIPNQAQVLRIIDLAGKEGLSLKRDVYKLLLTGGGGNTAYYLGLAETNLLMRKENEAIEVLNELALKQDYHYEQLFQIAQLLRKFEMYEQSNEFLEKVLSKNPGYLKAVLLKADLRIMQGKVQSGCDIALTVLSTNTGRAFREQAIDVIEDCGERGLSIIDAKLHSVAHPNEDLYIAKARILYTLKRREEALATLVICTEKFPYASSRVPLLLSEISDGEKSIEYLYKTLYLQGDSKNIRFSLISKLLDLERDEELKALISHSELSPSRYVSWYDTHEAHRQYLSKIRLLLLSMRRDGEDREVDSELDEILFKTSGFYERVEDYESAQFIIESLLLVTKNDALLKKIDEIKDKAEELRNKKMFIIQEALSNGESL
ncbi:MAG: hypothetical protein E3J78_00975 [Candidatus Cloacimonadota bacterium]|nr:MAG: hypothetical protein E3J78_00975 [Candidatus Cloacimonadota bacterium]